MNIVGKDRFLRRFASHVECPGSQVPIAGDNPERVIGRIVERMTQIQGLHNLVFKRLLERLSRHLLERVT